MDYRIHFHTFQAIQLKQKSLYQYFLFNLFSPIYVALEAEKDNQTLLYFWRSLWTKLVFFLNRKNIHFSQKKNEKMNFKKSRHVNFFSEKKSFLLSFTYNVETLHKQSFYCLSITLSWTPLRYRLSKDPKVQCALYETFHNYSFYLQKAQKLLY